MTFCGFEQPGQRVRELVWGAMIVKAMSEPIQQPYPYHDLVEQHPSVLEAKALPVNSPPIERGRLKQSLLTT